MSSTWQRVKLGDVAEARAGFAFKSDQFTDDPNDIPLVKGENVSQGRILWDISKRWPAAEWRKFATYQLRAGDVVVAMDRPWVPAGLKWAPIRDGDPDALLVQRVARLRAQNRDLEQSYLPALIGSPAFDDYLRPITTGVNVPHVSARQILDFEFRLPPVAVQRRIAGVLASYDDLIDNDLRRVQILEEMARSIYREWFVQFRFPGHEGVGRVDSPLGPIPAAWSTQSLGDVCHLTMGQSPPSKFYNAAGEGLPFHQGVKDFGARFPSDRLFCTCEGRLAEGGDILFSIRAPVGRMNIASKRMVMGRGLSAIRHREGHQAFLWEFLRDRFQEEDTMGNGAIFAAVTTGELASLQVLCPAAPMLERASAELTPLHRLTEVLTLQVEKLRATCDLLLPRLMSGQLTLPEAVSAGKEGVSLSSS